MKSFLRAAAISFVFAFVIGIAFAVAAGCAQAATVGASCPIHTASGLRESIAASRARAAYAASWAYLNPEAQREAWRKEEGLRAAMVAELVRLGGVKAIGR